MAISDGLTAPMSSPIGACKRSRAELSTPIAANLASPRVTGPRTKRADIETVRSQGQTQSEIVDLGIVAEHGYSGEGIEANPWKDFVRPAGEDRGFRKSLLIGESLARIDQRDVETGEERHWRQGLCDMNRSDNDEARWR